jgi:predicted membrane-bound dolichyl-phosphate-mannose-protein mannosyltransferase
MEIAPMDDNASSIQPSPAQQRTGIDEKHALKSSLNTNNARTFNNSNITMWCTEETTLNDSYVSFFTILHIILLLSSVLESISPSQN